MPQPWERRRIVYRRPIGPVSSRRADEAPEEYVRRREDDERRLREADRESNERVRREAYERGRHDARRERRSHPILTFVVVALAALGLVFIGLWVRSESPSTAGQQIGTAASAAADRTRDAVATVRERGPDVARDVAGEVREGAADAASSLRDGDADPAAQPQSATPTDTRADRP